VIRLVSRQTRDARGRIEIGRVKTRQGHGRIIVY